MEQNAICYVNGAFVRAAQAKISIFDRAFLFADGVYEVAAVLDGKLVDVDAHLARYERSLAALQMQPALTRAALVAVMREIVARNALDEGLVYIQQTRGAPLERDFPFPADAVQPTLVLFAHKKPVIGAVAAAKGVAVKSVADRRWARRDIKSVSLLAQVLAKQEARAAGCAEAFLVEDGFVTEGAASTAFIVTRTGQIVTRALSHAILPGCTRIAVMRLAEEAGLSVVERAFSIEEAQGAAECFITSATTFVTPVVMLDGRPIGSGAPGPVAQRLRALYIETARQTAQ
ncbi:MAG: D-amino-acid transaminase [Hyphomicrobiales bacterium]|nr:D-amino-acid transaminase [Hyphomicrobiales bacterium]